jgi:hypothetical protein
MLAPPSHWAPVHDHGGPMMLIAQQDVRALDQRDGSITDSGSA